MNILKVIKDFFMKNPCISCGRKIEDPYYNICTECVQKIRLFDEYENYCPKCHNTWYEKNICQNCEDQKIYWNSIISIYSYQDISAQLLLKKYKFDNSVTAEKDLIFMLKPHLIPYKDSEYIIIPAPCSYETKNRLGFNPVANLLKKLEIPYVDIFKKTDKKIQKRLSGFERKHQKKTIGVNQEIPVSWKEKHVLIVDDVMTTGSTLNNCAEVLKNKGIEHITILCFFRN